MNQDQLAELVGLSRASISNIENGRQPITVQTLWKIAQALGVPLRILVPEDSEIAAPSPEPASPAERYLEQVAAQVIHGNP